MWLDLLLGLLKPVVDMLERVIVGCVVEEERTDRISIVGARDGAESLLAGRVPNLQLDAHARLDLDDARVKVHAHCRVRVVGELAVAEVAQQRRLAHRRVANDDQSELVRIHFVFITRYIEILMIFYRFSLFFI